MLTFYTEPESKTQFPLKSLVSKATKGDFSEGHYKCHEGPRQAKTKEIKNERGRNGGREEEIQLEFFTTSGRELTFPHTARARDRPPEDRPLATAVLFQETFNLWGICSGLVSRQVIKSFY